MGTYPVSIRGGITPIRAGSSRTREPAGRRHVVPIDAPAGMDPGDQLLQSFLSCLVPVVLLEHGLIDEPIPGVRDLGPVDQADGCVWRSPAPGFSSRLWSA